MTKKSGKHERPGGNRRLQEHQYPFDLAERRRTVLWWWQYQSRPYSTSGRTLRMWTTYQHTEIPMPFMISSENWGIFNNTTRKNFFDIGNYQSDVFSIYNTTDEVDFYLMFGNSMPDVINYYTAITGRPYLLPKYAYGLCSVQICWKTNSIF